MTDFLFWDFDPVFVNFWFVTIYWYGLMFALAFISSYTLLAWFYGQEGYDNKAVDELLWYVAIGTIVGARLGHCVFYEPSYYLQHPFKILAIWEGGLASHGAIIGLLFSLYLYQKQAIQSYRWLLDRVAIGFALGGGFVRIGNFFNSEIVGIPTTVPWAVIFARIDSLPRHPVQLYESLAYFCIFAVLFALHQKVRDSVAPGFIFAVSLLLVFGTRLALELVKVRQASHSVDAVLSTGQWLSLPFLLLGIYLVFCWYRQKS